MTGLGLVECLDLVESKIAKQILGLYSIHESEKAGLVSLVWLYSNSIHESD